MVDAKRKVINRAVPVNIFYDEKVFFFKYILNYIARKG